MFGFFLFIRQTAGKTKEYCLKLASYLSAVFLRVLAMLKRSRIWVCDA